MIGSFVTRGMIMLLGYVYPAYECFKAVEKNRPNVQQLRFWCQYWIIIAVITVVERVADVTISWLPMYFEAKLAFIIYLWIPNTKGTSYIYSNFLKPYVSSHEVEIDRKLSEFRIRAGDMAYSYWRLSSGYITAKVFEFLQFVASQSSRPQVNSQSSMAHHSQMSRHHPQQLPLQTVSELPVSAPSLSQSPPAPVTGYAAALYSTVPHTIGVPFPKYPVSQSGRLNLDAISPYSVSPTGPISNLGSSPPNYSVPDYTASAPPATDYIASTPPELDHPPQSGPYMQDMVQEEKTVYSATIEQVQARSSYPIGQRSADTSSPVIYRTRSRRHVTN